MKFSEKIRTLRIRNNLSQEDLAEQLNISRQTISKWEAGNSLPEIEKLIIISELFQVSIDYLLKDKQVNVKSSEDLDRMIIQFLDASYDMADISRELVNIMEDGIIDSEESIRMESIICTLDRISENITKIRKAFGCSCDPACERKESL